MESILDRRVLVGGSLAASAVAFIGTSSNFLNKSVDLAEAIERFGKKASELFEDDLSRLQRMVNTLLVENKLPYRADFNKLTEPNTNQFGADFNISPADSEVKGNGMPNAFQSRVLFDRGKFRAEQAAHLIIFTGGVALFLQKVARIRDEFRQLSALKGMDVHVQAEFEGVSDGEGFNSLLKVVYGGEYGKEIHQRAVVVGGERHDFSLTEGQRVTNLELAFLRAYSVAQVLWNQLAKADMSMDILSGVTFHANEVKNVGSEFRVGTIRLCIATPDDQVDV